MGSAFGGGRYSAGHESLAEEVAGVGRERSALGGVFSLKTEFEEEAVVLDRFGRVVHGWAVRWCL